MKLFKATIESKNPCYLHTLLVVAENEEQADKQLCEHQGRKVKYTQPLKELNVDMTKPNVIEYVGWGHSDSDCGYDD